MEASRYTEIRNLPNFLHLYFVEEIGQGVAQAQFEEAFNAWLMMIIQVHPQIGTEVILKYLDKKHNFNLASQKN